MNIVLIRSNPVRPYPRLEKMAGCLLRRGYGVIVLAWDRDDNYKPKSEILQIGVQSCKIIRIGLKGQFSGGIKKNLEGLIKFQQFIYKWLKVHRREYDVVHAYDLDTGFTAQRAAKAFHKIFIYDIPDYYCDSHFYTGLLRKAVILVENSVINSAFATIICTEDRIKQISGSNPKRLYVIHNTPNVSVVYMEPSKENIVKLAYIGIFGNGRFLREICEFVSNHKNLEFHIGGYGANMEEFFSSMSEKNKNIIYYGKVPYQRTLEIERGADILPIIYNPSLNENVYAAPNKFYEALALGKPMIMAKRTGMSSVLEKYDLGETIEYNSESFEKAIERLIARKGEWAEIEKREQALYESTYSWNEMEKRIHRLYDEVELALKG